jgi:hypothetical protein
MNCDGVKMPRGLRLGGSLALPTTLALLRASVKQGTLNA